MKKALINSGYRVIGLSALAGFALCLQAPVVVAQGSTIMQPAETMVEAEKSLSHTGSARVSKDAYILGPGDRLQIELLDLPELSGSFSIGPDGSLYLPRLRDLYVEGLTVEELRHLLTASFSTYVRSPSLCASSGLSADSHFCRQLTARLLHIHRR